LLPFCLHCYLVIWTLQVVTLSSWVQFGGACCLHIYGWWYWLRVINSVFSSETSVWSYKPINSLPVITIVINIIFPDNPNTLLMHGSLHPPLSYPIVSKAFLLIFFSKFYLHLLRLFSWRLNFPRTQTSWYTSLPLTPCV